MYFFAYFQFIENKHTLCTCRDFTAWNQSWITCYMAFFVNKVWLILWCGWIITSCIFYCCNFHASIKFRADLVKPPLKWMSRWVIAPRPFLSMYLHTRGMLSVQICWWESSHLYQNILVLTGKFCMRQVNAVVTESRPQLAYNAVMGVPVF